METLIFEMGGGGGVLVFTLLMEVTSIVCTKGLRGFLGGDMGGLGVFFLDCILRHHESAMSLSVKGEETAAEVFITCPHKYYHLNIQLNGADASYNQAFRELVG